MQKKSYGTLSKGAIFFGQPCRIIILYSFERAMSCVNSNDL